MSNQHLMHLLYICYIYILLRNAVHVDAIFMESHA